MNRNIEARTEARTAWTLPVARVAGIPVRAHVTMLLLVAWWLFPTWARVLSGAATVEQAFDELVVLLALFASIVLHELGHALVARRYGATTKEIVLLPIGGVARIDALPTAPRAELAIALAGPAVSVALAATLYAATIVVTGGLLVSPPSHPEASVINGATLLGTIATMNLVLGVFNLLPAFPMDGGRALRALLSTRMPRVRATVLAARIGQALAVLLGLLGMLTNPFLIFVALFVWIGAADEASESVVEQALQGHPARRAMMRDVRVLRIDSILADAVALTLDGAQRDFPVVDGDVVRGLLTQASLLRGLARDGAQGAVAASMEPVTVKAALDESLSGVVARMHEGAAPAVVVDGDKLRGMITPENVVELIALDAAVRAPHAA